MIQLERSLEGKVAIVTGGTRPSGMGHQSALAMAALGADIVTCGLTESRPDLTGNSHHMVGGSASRLDERVAEIKELGVDAVGVPCDVTKKEDILNAVKISQEKFGGVDILFNNAGVPTGGGPFLAVQDDAWEIQWNICVRAMAWFCQSVIPIMQVRGGGSIINNSSMWALKPLPGASPYVAAKAGMIALTKSLAQEFGPDQIRVNCMLPGTYMTEMHDSRAAMEMDRQQASLEEVRARMAEPTSLNRLGKGEEMGATVAFLAGPGASYITGAVIKVDGGLTNGL